MNQNTKRYLETVQLHELFVEDLNDSDSTIHKYLRSLAVNIILRTLFHTDRLDFYKILENKDHKKINDYINDKIPDLKTKMINSFQTKLKTVLVAK